MTLGSKKQWKSIVPQYLRGKSVPRFCLFSKVKPTDHSPGNTSVYLNVYDLTPANGYVYWAGLGIFHSAVEGTFDCLCCILRPIDFLISLSMYSILVSSRQ